MRRFRSLLKVGALWTGVCGLSIIADYERTISCDNAAGYSFHNGRCVKINRVTPKVHCPPSFFLADSKCNQAVKPKFMCPDDMILTFGDRFNMCEATISTPCGFECPEHYVPSTTRGISDGCVREIDVTHQRHCPIGVMENDMCVVATTQPLVETCAEPTSVLDHGECLSLSLMHDCSAYAKLNLASKSPTDPCLRVLSTTPTMSCPKGYGKHEDRCVKKEYLKPTLSCAKTLKGSRCVDLHTTATRFTCKEGFVMKDIFGQMCACTKKLQRRATIECPIDAEFHPELDQCIRKNDYRFECPEGYQLKNTFCERPIMTQAQLIFNVTLSCDIDPRSPHHNCAAYELAKLQPLFPNADPLSLQD